MEPALAPFRARAGLLENGHREIKSKNDVSQPRLFYGKLIIGLSFGDLKIPRGPTVTSHSQNFNLPWPRRLSLFDDRARMAEPARALRPSLQTAQFGGDLARAASPDP